MKYAVQQSREESSVTDQQEAAHTQIKGPKFVKAFLSPPVPNIILLKGEG